ncbi:MAG: lysoplasmalogenase [Brevefilum sp.]|nr:lysoplasmalogenase [Brevefilum sp.]
MTLLVFVGFLFDWLAVALNWRKIKPIAKILALTLVILWTMDKVSWSINLLILLLLLAQLFGLVGDIFLLLSKRWFLPGLGAFLVGHLFYIALLMIDLAFVVNLSINELFFPAVIAAVLWGFTLWIVYGIFKQEHFISHRHGKVLWVLVELYIWVLSGLMFLTFVRFFLQPGFEQTLWLLPAGGLLFLISDTLLAYDRFVSRINRGQLWVHMTYHLAQFCLAWGFLVIFRQI